MKRRNDYSGSKLDLIVRLLIPPSLIILLAVTIIELFYHVGNWFLIFIDVFDAYVIFIFAIDLYYRWKELPHFFPYLKRYFLDIIATIPFNFIFYGVQGLSLIRALRGIGILARVARWTKIVGFARTFRLVRFGTRAPRFLRLKKHIKEARIKKVQPHEKEMKGVLSFKVIFLITINSIMGTGIYFLTAAGARHAGPASLISWGILSLISIYIAMCFSELTAMFPKAGGVYEFAKQAYGRFWSFVIGWTTAIAGSVTIAMLLLGALQYILPQNPGWYIPIAFALILIFNSVAYKGMQTSTVMLVSFALITIGTVVSLIVPGLFNFNPDNYNPFFVFPTFAIVLTIFFIAETFFGWESAVFLSAETKNPTKVMPKALIYGTLVIACLSFFLALSAMGVIPWQQYAESAAPLRDLGGVLFGNSGMIIFMILVFVSIIGAVATWVVTAPRLLMSIAEDKLFFVQFAKIHPKYKSPYVSIIFQMFVLAILVYIGSGSYYTLLHLLIPLIILVYSAVLLSVVILRFKKPDLNRPYKVFFGKIGPFVTIFFMVFLMFMFVIETKGALDILRISASLVLFGIPAYFAIELFYDPKYVTLRRNLVARVQRYFHKIPRPHPMYNRMIKYVGSFNKNSVIVDYNSPVGIITSLIIRKKMPFKEIHLVSSSKEEIAHVRSYFGSPRIITHASRSGRLPSKLRKADIFMSYNDLGYVKKIEQFLSNVQDLLPKGGKFCFHITFHFLNVAPNSIAVSNRSKMKELFARYKLEAEYRVRRLPFHRDIFIYGIKK